MEYEPQLMGQDNFKEWESAIMDRLKRNGLEGFIDGVDEPPENDATTREKIAYKQKRLTAYTIIRTTIDPVMGMMKRKGYRDVEDDGDPQYLWEFTREAVLHGINVLSLDAMIQELTRLDFKAHGSLKFYLARFNFLNDALRNQGIKVPDELLQSFLLKGLYSYDAFWADSLLVELQYGRLTYNTLLDLVTEKAEPCNKCR
jgi:hypothetical protein